MIELPHWDEEPVEIVVDADAIMKEEEKHGL